MSEEIKLTLNSPITEEQWDAINDFDFDHTEEIEFHTKHGKTVRFKKENEGQQKSGRYVDLSERVTATYYDCEYEEWSEKTVTVEEVLDTTCDDYTVVEMPSVEPEKRTEERTETHACDLIDRQAAIDTVKRHYRAHDNDLLEVIVYWLEKLPSAQPLDVQLAYYKGVNDGIKQCTERLKRATDAERGKE